MTSKGQDRATDEQVACECGAALGEHCPWTGPRSETVVVEWLPMYLRESAHKAGNHGQWPHNGAQRLRVERTCAERLTHRYDDDGEPSREGECEKCVAVVEG